MVCLGVFYTAPPRHYLIILCFFAIVLGFAMRQVLSLTIQEMTYPIQGRGPRLQKDLGNKYKWTDFQQACVLMGFYIGYSISHFFSAPIINAIGSRAPLAIGMAFSAGMTALIPNVSTMNWAGVMTLRIITGIGQATLLPGISSLLTYWVPLENRAPLSTIIYAGVPLGNFLGFYLSAVVVAYWEYWPYTYYMWACYTFVWLAFFIYNVYSYPRTHPRITSQGSSYQKDDFIKAEDSVKVEKLTYCSQTIATFGHTYILYTLDTYLPKYLNEVLEYELEDYSIYAATPFALMYVCGFLSRAIFNSLVNRRNINADILRLVYCSLFNVLAGVLLVVAVAFAPDYSATVSFLHLASFMGGFFYGGLNMMDMSWRNTRIAMSVVYGLATTSGVVAILVVAFVVRDGRNEEWQTVSYVLLTVELLVWIMDAMFTMTKLCLVSYDTEKKWYQNIPVEIHAEKMTVRKEAKEKLMRKQRGDLHIQYENDEDPSSAGPSTQNTEI